MGNLDHFSAAAKHRCEVYIRTVTAMRTINDTIASRSSLRAQLNAKATRLIRNANMSETLAAIERYITESSAYRYGNLGVVYGYGNTPVEVEAAALRRRADAIANENLVLQQRSRELLQEWMAVE